MNEALNEAIKAYQIDEVPVGCIIVYNNKIIGRGHNVRETYNHVMTHAEIIAILQASEYLQSWRLEECVCYVTLEPCLMCAGALIQSRIKKIVYGAKDPKGGVFGSLLNINEIKGFNHYPEIVSGVLKDECAKILKDYFKEKRNNNRR